METVYKPMSSEPADAPAIEVPIVSAKDVAERLHGESPDQSELTLEEGVKAKTRSRPLREATPENAVERPLIKYSFDDDDDRPRSLREAYEDRTVSKHVQAERELREAGWTDQQINAVAKEVSEGLMHHEPPPVRVGLVNDKGERVEPLGDYQRITADDALSAHEAARHLGNWREVAEAERQAQLAALLPEAPPPSPTREQQQQPTEQQPAEQLTPEQLQLQRIAQERQAIEQMKRWDIAEVMLRQKHAELIRAGVAAFPNVKTPQDVARLAQEDPGRYRVLKQFEAAADQCQAGLNQAALAREARRAADRYERQTRREKFAKAEDAKFDAEVGKILPHHNIDELRKQAVETLKSAGLDDKTIAAHHRGRPIDMRSMPAQTIIAKAAAWDQAQARARQATRAPAPPVQRPGTIRPAGGGGDLQSLQAKLTSAKGSRAALRAATDLIKARRARG
jgi:hypothetical protein